MSGSTRATLELCGDRPLAEPAPFGSIFVHALAGVLARVRAGPEYGSGLRPRAGVGRTRRQGPRRIPRRTAAAAAAPATACAARSRRRAAPARPLPPPHRRKLLHQLLRRGPVPGLEAHAARHKISGLPGALSGHLGQPHLPPLGSLPRDQLPKHHCGQQRGGGQVGLRAIAGDCGRER